MSAPLTDDLIARLRGLRSMVGEIDQSIADLGEAAAEALAASSRPTQEPTTFAAIKRAIQRLEHGHYADPLDCFCGSDIIDRDAVLAVIDAAIAQGAPAAPPPWQPTYPIPLNAQQEQAAKEWAADDRLWTTQETVEFNLRTFARKILSALPSPPASTPSDEKMANDTSKQFSRLDMDAATKPLHAEIERLRLAVEPYPGWTDDQIAEMKRLGAEMFRQQVFGSPPASAPKEKP